VSAVTKLLEEAAEGRQGAFEEAIALVYDELKRVAGKHVRRAYGARTDDVTLEPEALVHEAFLKLLDQREPFRNRAQLLAIASRVMLRALVDYQRARGAARRGGGQVRVTLSGLERSDGPSLATASDLASALDRLDEQDARKAEVVKLRILWGLTNPEIARTLDISVPTVEREWRFARAWLANELSRI
jgi:RNA polymerase sigma factor (TIGR02999 family)